VCRSIPELLPGQDRDQSLRTVFDSNWNEKGFLVMADLKNPKMIWAKGALFLFLGFFASTLLLLSVPEWRVALLHGLAIWAFCRFYYFVFYVIEHYVDSTYRFSGVLDFLRYLVDGQRKRLKEEESA